MRFKLLKTCFVLLFLILNVTVAQAATTVWVPFKLNNGHIVLPVVVNGVEGEALLDSGASSNAISSRIVNYHGDGLVKAGKVKVNGVYGVQKLDVISRVPVTMFGVDFKISDVISSSLGSYELLLGLGFFDKFVVQLDYPNHRMRLSDRKSLNLKDISNVRLLRDSRFDHPIVEVTLDKDKSAWLIFDTGNSGGLMLSRSFVEYNGWLEKYQTKQSYGSGINIKGASTEVFYMDDFKIGPFELENVRVTVPAEGQSSLLGVKNTGGLVRSNRGKKTEGLLGYDILKHFVVTIDFRKNLLHLGLPQE